jgi:hypothetical protein
MSKMAIPSQVRGAEGSPKFDCTLYPSPTTSVSCSVRLVQTGGSYWRTLASLPPNTRISALEEISSFVRSGNQGGKLPLENSLFDDLLRGDTPLWEWTHLALRAPQRAPDFAEYAESHHGRTYYRSDLIVADRVVAEGILIPEGTGQAVIKWDERLGLPAEVSMEPTRGHMAHFYFDPANAEVAIILRGNQYVNEETSCVDIVAQHPRSLALRYCAYRPFSGSIEQLDIGLPSVAA